MIKQPLCPWCQEKLINLTTIGTQTVKGWCPVCKCSELVNVGVSDRERNFDPRSERKP